jgi:hypothetical protein
MTMQATLQTDPIGRFWEQLMRIAKATDAAPLNKHEGCWEFGDPDRGWYVAVNAHEAPVKCYAGAEVPPFHAYVMWFGFPAGLITPAEGTIAAGAAANMDTLLAWLEALPRGGPEAPA